MDWISTLEREAASAYRAADTLMSMVGDDELAWSPPVPEGGATPPWMTMGQLLHHITESCGAMCDAFVRDDWSILTQGEPGGPMASAASVAQAREALEADRRKALAAIRAAGNDRLLRERVQAPWGIEGSLGEQMLDSVKHLGQHKGQLFYYLKMLGRPVDTSHLWGMAGAAQA